MTVHGRGAAAPGWAAVLRQTLTAGVEEAGPVKATLRTAMAARLVATPSSLRTLRDHGCFLERVGEPFTEIDIEQDDELHARLLERIPVVVLDDEELFEHFVDERTLRARLKGLPDHVE